MHFVNPVTPNARHVALFVPSLRGGGAEKVMVTLANGFAEKGLKVDILLAQAEGPYLKDVMPDVRVVDFKSSRVLKSIPKLVRYLSAEKPDCLLSALNHANLVAIACSLLAGRASRVIVSEHNSIFGSPSASVREWVIKKFLCYVYTLSDAVIAVSQGVATDLKRAGVPGRLVQTIYNPVVSDKLLEDSQLPCEHPWVGDNAKPLIVAVGRLEPQKDYETLIRAFALVATKHDANLLIFGEGSLRANLQTLIDGLGLSRRVELAGFVGNPYAYMSRAAVFALSSRWEGLPTVLIEALACGAALVSTDCREGPSEILDHGKWGTLVPVGNAEAFADAISSALQHGRPKAGFYLERAMSFSVARAVTEYARVLQGENA